MEPLPQLLSPPRRKWFSNAVLPAIGRKLMIWNSIGLMTAIDVALLTMVGALLVIVGRQLINDPEQIIRRGAGFVAGGLGLIAAFYGLDLFVMWILAPVTSQTFAMSVMENVHLNVQWVVNLIGVGCICAGFL